MSLLIHISQTSLARLRNYQMKIIVNFNSHQWGSAIQVNALNLKLNVFIN